MIEAAVTFVGALAVGAAGGAAFAWRRTGSPPSLSGVGPGPWRTKAGIGDGRMSAFERAALARTGIWALPDREVLYYVTETDSDGAALDPGLTYRLKGPAQQPCRWWSLALYRDYFFVENPEQRYSYCQTSVIPDARGMFEIYAGPGDGFGDWLPTGGPGARMTLLFRLYQPHDAALADRTLVPLPTVTKLQ